SDRYGGGLEIVRQVDDRLADRRVLLVAGAIGHERAVELKLGYGDLIHARQRQEATAEVINGGLDAERLRLRHEVAAGRQVAGDLVLGNIENEARPFLAFAPVFAHDLRQRHFEDGRNRDVYG